MPILRLTAWLLAGLILVPAPRAQAQKVDWPTYGFDSYRSGYNPNETILGPSTVSGLKLAWAFDPGAFEIANINPSWTSASATMDGQPILAQGVPVAGTPTDLVLIGDNNGVFYALDANSAAPGGTVVWYNAIGTAVVAGCHNVPTTLGLRATAAVDRGANGGNGAVYVAANGMVHALDLASGAELAGWPVMLPMPHPPKIDGAIHDGVNVVNGQLYVGTGSTCDQAPWFGRMVRIDTAAAAVSGTWYALSGTAAPPAGHANGGGIWGSGGAAVDPTAAVGGVYVATGNAPNLNQPLYSEYVVDLSPDLTTTVGYAAPAVPPGNNDFSTTPVVFQPASCPLKLLAAQNKMGMLVLEQINPDGSLTVLQSSQMGQPPKDFIGQIAWDPVDQLVIVSTPTSGPAPYAHTVTALQISAGCANPVLSVAWQTTQQINGQPFSTGNLSSPTIANGLAFVTAAGKPVAIYAIATSAGTGYAAGQVLWQANEGSRCVYAEVNESGPIVVNGMVLTTCRGPSNLVQAYALPPPAAAAAPARP